MVWVVVSVADGDGESMLVVLCSFDGGVVSSVAEVPVVTDVVVFGVGLVGLGIFHHGGGIVCRIQFRFVVVFVLVGLTVGFDVVGNGVGVFVVNDGSGEGVRVGRALVEFLAGGFRLVGTSVVVASTANPVVVSDSFATPSVLVVALVTLGAETVVVFVTACSCEERVGEVTGLADAVVLSFVVRSVVLESCKVVD